MKENKSKKIIIGIIFAVIVVAAGVVLTFVISSSSKLNFENYITDTIEFEGKNGTASVKTDLTEVVDIDRLLSDMQISQTDYSSLSIKNMSEPIQIHYKDKTIDGKLKNDDVVTIIISVDYDKMNQLAQGKKLKGKGIQEISKEYTVQGLEELETINPFDVIKKVVVYKEDEAFEYYTKKLVVDTSKKFLNYTVAEDENDNFCYHLRNDEGEDKVVVYFDTKNIVNIKAGDSIELTLNKDSKTQLEKLGYQVEETSKKIKVATAQLLTDYSKINKSNYDLIKIKFENYVKSLNRDYSIDGNLASFKDIYYRNINNNRFTLVALYQYQEDSVGAGVEYIPFLADDVYFDSDGEVVFKQNIHFDITERYQTINDFVNTYSKVDLGEESVVFNKIVK